ncbi:hypothetical protein ODZ83_11010 [Acaricomes phytoseiuli]|uniref:hypothetical protein n=1 Tax=Acaricomes phytoseiuli TaxID=291968 RepID=UPI0022225C7F|nr:hypothetical protein [Acaricomes phytoseiuli]MCW1250691.1 hypothetical protein [Acaricomes phytoseiuli]
MIGDWDEDIILGVLAALGGVFSALLGFLTGKSRQRFDLIDQVQEERDIRVAEIDRLERKVDELYADKHASRLYVGALIDHILHRRDPPPPDPPEHYKL